MTFDLAISYVWIYDIEFTQLVEKMFQAEGYSTFIIGKHNVYEITERVKKNELNFKVHLDRASDEDENFAELVQLLKVNSTYPINDFEKVEKAIDKSIMHPKLLDAGIKIPKTIILPPFDKQTDIEIDNLDEIGRPFIIKPAYYSGGGWGVIKDASSPEQVRETRKENPDDSYLVQELIRPKLIEGKRAWFRPLYAFGNIIISYWDDHTHLYSLLPEDHFEKYGLKRIERIVKKIERIAQLDYFSCEITLAEDDEFYLIDYVNDQCDMRLKSSHTDGVPDEVVKEFIKNMIGFVSEF